MCPEAAATGQKTTIKIYIYQVLFFGQRRHRRCLFDGECKHMNIYNFFHVKFMGDILLLGYDEKKK